MNTSIRTAYEKAVANWDRLEESEKEARHQERKNLLKVSLFLRFFQAQFAPGTIQTVTVSVALAKTIRISLNTLDASNEMGYIRTIAT